MQQCTSYAYILMTMQSYGEFVSGSISEEERKYVLHNSCPGSGSCGSMYAPNTVASQLRQWAWAFHTGANYILTLMLIFSNLHDLTFALFCRISLTLLEVTVLRKHMQLVQD
jgi:hypothetical protein